jgi:hypothetical protein
MSMREVHSPLTILEVRESLATLHQETVKIPDEFRMRSQTWEQTLRPLLLENGMAGSNCLIFDIGFMGMKIITDETIAPNEIEVRDTNGCLIQVLRFGV